MPNWCHNTLTVIGSPQEVSDFVEVVKTDEQPLSFFALIPAPDGLFERSSNRSSLDSILGSEDIPEDEMDWYSWSILKFSTKWDCSFSEPMIGMTAEGYDPAEDPHAPFVQQEGIAVYRFDTAWSPPTNWLITVGKMYPNLKFQMKYGEPGMGYGGIMTVEGDKVEDREVDIEDTLDPSMMWY